MIFAHTNLAVSAACMILSNHVKDEIDLGQMANLKLVDKQGKELVELKLQVLA